MPAVDDTKDPSKPKLVQATLTKAFFSPSKTTTTKIGTTTSPYFAKPPPPPTNDISTWTTNTSDPSQPAPNAPLNLYPERRANLPASSPPTLSPSSSSTSSPTLARIAAETKSLLPSLLETIPHAPPTGILYTPSDLHALHSHRCPHLPGTPIRVVNADTLDTALALAAQSAAAATTDSDTNSTKPPLVLNMANAEHGGGGWLKGALAQEESMCYRSSLSFTLKRRFYPLGEEDGVYSPSVVVFRDSLARGHGVLDLGRPGKLGVVSVVSVAAIRDPDVVVGNDGEEKYKWGRDRVVMKRKMRVVLRTAGRERHRLLVLGALGCGAFGNPKTEVVRCWKEVFMEAEFKGWWESVVFAVMEDGGRKDGMGNFGVFWRGLHGVMV